MLFSWQYGIGPSASMTGEPNCLIGLQAVSPSAADPQWQATIAANFVPEPSGAWTSVAATEHSSGIAAVKSR